jgi:site-specific DNA-cytosine methylase
MSKEIDTKQMSLLGDSHANHFQSQEKEKEQMTTDTSGTKLLESLENVDPNGLLGKMLMGLLISKTAWYSDRCKMIWKKRVSKSNVLLFQLQALVLGIKEKEFGLLGVMYPTPTSIQRPNEGNMRMMRKQVLQGSISRKEATAMVGKDIFKAHGKVKMYPTPTVNCEEGGEQSERIEQTKSGGFLLRKKNKPEMTFGAKLSDAMIYLEKKKIYNTPTTNDSKNLTFPQSQKNRTSIIGNMIQQQKIKPGGKLNPTFVEFLMGYPMDWTKIEPTESKALGNSIVPQIARELGKAIIEAEKDV